MINYSFEDRKGVIYMNNEKNKKSMTIADLKNSSKNFDKTEDEKIDISAKKILEKYRAAFEELAK